VKDLRDRVAVVTGGASGIGLATAERFAAEGMRIVVSDIEESALAKARDQLSERGADVLAVPADVTRPESVDALARAALDRFGAVHVVFNNAGVVVAGAVWETSLDDLRWTLDVNLWGVIHGMRTFVPILIEQNVPAHVVNTASVAALTTAPYLDIYTATKFAVLSLTECLYKELLMLGSPVRASVVCPGLIRTNLMDCDRNRPGDLASDPRTRELSPAGRLMHGFLGAGVEQGWPPAKVADAIVEGIREERLYVIPAQEELLAGIDRRLDDLRERRNPEVPRFG
jgi:NAD(P)-dependent dehydrogenase (short-subunit alcohol dehydrogenase family)